jgi:hypothetical protein
METIVKKFLLTAAFAGAFASGAIAQTPNPNLAPRDPPFGKGNPGNDTMHEPNSAGSAHSDISSDQSIPPRDPPFGRGNAGNDTTHLPSSAGTRGMAGDGAKSEMSKATKKIAATKSAMKKDTAKKDAAPKDDTN